MRRTRRRREPLRVHHGNREHDQRNGLVGKREQQRRLIDECENAKAYLKGQCAQQRGGAKGDRAKDYGAAAPAAHNIGHMQDRGDPDPIGQHAMVKLNQQGILEEIAP